jgi:hypothetical protein
MNQKKLVNTTMAIAGVVVLVCVAGYFIMNQQTLLPWFAFSPTPKENPEDPTDGSVALSPYIEFEATVISLSLDKLENYYEGGQLINAPNDAAIIKIDKIIGTGGSYNFDWASIGIESDKEVSVYFKYTARPTKIITFVGETTQSGDTVSRNIVPTKISFENNYFVFKEDRNSETETILPGLQIGSKFKTKFWFTDGVKVEKYEIIP